VEIIEGIGELREGRKQQKLLKDKESGRGKGGAGEDVQGSVKDSC
jgi:hypothetical protein